MAGLQYLGMVQTGRRNELRRSYRQAGQGHERMFTMVAGQKHSDCNAAVVRIGSYLAEKCTNNERMRPKM